MNRRALVIAKQNDLSATYDAHYLALAEMQGCDLWTADQRLLRQLGARMPSVHALATYQPMP